MRHLQNKQLQVSRGYPVLWTAQDCDLYTYPVLKNCQGNNPVSPYVMPVVKSWPDEFVDPAMTNAFVKTPPGYSGTYRLDPREAMVIYGQLPPPGRYMGLQSWVATKQWLPPQQPWDPAAYDKVARVSPPLANILFAKVPGNPARIQSFSSLSNNINNVVIQRQSGASFGARRYFVITPDRKMDAVIRRTLTGQGVRNQDIFTEPIPPSDERGLLGPLGLGKDANDFWTLIRYAMPVNEQAGNAWRHSLPLTVLRVRENPASRRAAEAYPPFVPDPRTAANESYLSGDLTKLLDAVCARAGSAAGGRLNLGDSGCGQPAANTQLIDLQADLGLFGPQCRSIGMNCLGDTQDTSYFLTNRRIDPRKLYALVGTLATRTGNATYVSLSVNDLVKVKGVANVNDPELNGSADSYAATVHHTGKFFVHYFARNCDAFKGLTGGACTTITEDMVPAPPQDVSSTDLRGLFGLAVRAYVRPGTERGPDSTQQLRPRLLTFTQP